MVVFKDSTSIFLNEVDNLKSMINNHRLWNNVALIIAVRYINMNETYNFIRNMESWPLNLVAMDSIADNLLSVFWVL